MGVTLLKGSYKCVALFSPHLQALFFFFKTYLINLFQIPAATKWQSWQGVLVDAATVQHCIEDDALSFEQDRTLGEGT